LRDFDYISTEIIRTVQDQDIFGKTFLLAYQLKFGLPTKLLMI